MHLKNLFYRQTKKSTWDVGRSMRYNQDAQRSEGKFMSYTYTLSFTSKLKFRSMSNSWFTIQDSSLVCIHLSTNEPFHEIMALSVLRKLILQTRMRSHPVGLDVWFLVWPYLYFHASCMRTAKALARLRGWAGSPEPLLVACVIGTIISWAGSNTDLRN